VLFQPGICDASPRPGLGSGEPDETGDADPVASHQRYLFFSQAPAEAGPELDFRLRGNTNPARDPPGKRGP
jgi:hypothetical protein